MDCSFTLRASGFCWVVCSPFYLWYSWLFKNIRNICRCQHLKELSQLFKFCDKTRKKLSTRVLIIIILILLNVQLSAPVSPSFSMYVTYRYIMLTNWESNLRNLKQCLSLYFSLFIRIFVQGLPDAHAGNIITSVVICIKSKHILPTFL